MGGSQRKAADCPHQTDSNELVQHLIKMPRGWLLGEVFAACPGSAPGHAGEIMSIGWFGITSVRPSEVPEKVFKKRDVWEFLLQPSKW